MINVLDYGAKGDGVANDQAAFKAAIEAAAYQGGGVVYAPAGTYLIGAGGPDDSDGAITLLSNVTLQGAGMGATVLKLVDDVGQQINGFVRTPYGQVTTDVTLRDLTLDGNRENNTTKANAFLCGVAPGDARACEDVTISNVEVRNFSGYGFDPHERTIRLTIEDSVAHHNGLDGFVADFQIDSVFRNNIAYANDRHGFNIVTSTTNFLMENNSAFDNGGTGITIQRGSDPSYAFTSDITVQGGSVFDNGKAGIEVKLARDVVLDGIDIHDNAKEGIKISGSENVEVTGNLLSDNGLAGSSGYYNAVSVVDQLDSHSGLTFHSSGVAVTNNTINSVGSIQTGYGVFESSSTTAISSFTGNSIDGQRSGDVLIDGQLYDQSGAAVGGGGVFDVKAFGAKGDGIADDTAEIQAAIDAAHAAGGGTVYMGAGTYKVSGTSDKSDGAIRLLDDVTLQGAGMGETIIKVRDNNPYAITGVVRTPFNEITHDVALYDLTIDGNRAHNINKIDGFYTGVRPGDPRQDHDITVERVEVMNMTGYGFDPHEQTLRLRIADSVSHHNVLDGFVADYLIDSVFENNIAYANDRHGFNVTTSTFGLQLLDNTAYGNGSAGLVIQRGSEDIPAPHDILIQGGSYYGNAREGIYVKIGEDVLISDVQVHGNLRQGIRLDGTSGVVVDDSAVGNNSQLKAGQYDEIQINRFDDTAGSSGRIFGSTDNRVENSSIFADGAIRGRYGIYEALDVAGLNTLANNVITGLTKGASYFAPQLVTPAQDQTAQAGSGFSYQVAPESFFDADRSDLRLTATLVDGSSLPSWLTFDPLTGQFSGTPPVAATYQIAVRATDAQALNDVTTFALTIAAAGVTEIIGTEGADALSGGAGAQEIHGLGGDDVLIGAGGADLLDGGDGIDLASYEQSGAGVVVDLQQGVGSGGDAEGDRLRLVENLVGSAFADQLSGDAGVNVLVGGAGNDVLRGRGGNDTLDGGTGADQLEGGDGDDVYLVDNANDVVTELDNGGLGGNDTVRSSVSHALLANVENLVLLGTAGIAGIGNGKNNTLTGNAGDNLLDGGAGNDMLIGGLGDDTYVVNTSSDAIVEAVDAGIDTVQSAGSRTLEVNVENLVLLGSADVNATGNDAANVLTGNAGINILTGNGGDDTLLGGDGNDTLKGGAGADFLDGGQGVDQAVGGDGNDTYVIDNVGDTVVESANSGAGGIDTVLSSVSYTLASNVENLSLTGTGAINATGNSAANLLIGNAAANLLDGGSGIDDLRGGFGNDRLIGGVSSDRLDGGAGRDTAVFAGSLASYTLSTAGGGLQIKDRDAAADGNDGIDSLSGIETLEFKGGATINLAAAVVVDFDRNGVKLVDLAGSNARFDFLGDGQTTHTGWFGSGDALLVFDRNGDGTVSGVNELSFDADEPGARSGLDGLSAFDSNSDGWLSAADEAFSRFLLWSDDGDGAVEGDELAGLGTLAQSISLSGATTSQNWAAGANIVANNGTLVGLDGSALLLADVFLLHDGFTPGLSL
ncbi:MAG: glycosyl hydrolase family 28-related protein [Novosphingobium sp.]